MSFFKDPFVKKFYDKILEEKSTPYLTNPNKNIYELLNELVKKEVKISDNLEDKIKELETRLTKILASTLIRHKSKKISKFLNLSLSNPSYLEIMSLVENRIYKKFSEKLSLIEITSETGIPVVYAEEGMKYGPFKKGDIVFISESFSSLLIKKKLARLIGNESS